MFPRKKTFCSATYLDVAEAVKLQSSQKIDAEKSDTKKKPGFKNLVVSIEF